jgi:hypothetical protein
MAKERRQASTGVDSLPGVTEEAFFGETHITLATRRIQI